MPLCMVSIQERAYNGTHMVCKIDFLSVPGYSIIKGYCQGIEGMLYCGKILVVFE